MWVIQSGACEELNATVFHYSKNRTKAIALELLKNFHGYLTTDAYKVYEYLGNEDIKHNFCWSHCRRYFIESIPLDTKGKEMIDALLPWSQELPDKCCLSRSKKKHLKK